MRRRIPHIISLLLPALLSLLLISCPLPITEALVAALEDDFNPRVVFDSHDDGDTFYSSLVLEGYITDDAISSGDRKGQLSSLSIVIDKEGLEYSGGILIDSSGHATVDSSLGPVPVVFMPDGTFSFTLDTSNLDDDITVIVTAVDLNGNISDEKLRLDASRGPYLLIDSPSTGDYFSSGSDIVLSGTVATSGEILDNIDEIAYLRFYITPSAIEEELDFVEAAIDGDAAMTNQGTLEAPLYIQDIDALTPAQFRLENTNFTCTFKPTDSMNETMVLYIQAVDKNGMDTIEDVTLFFSDGGPKVDITSPLSSGNFHSSNPLIADNNVTLTTNVRSTSDAVVYVYYQMNINSGGWGSEIPLYIPDGIIETGFIGIRSYTSSFDPDSYTGDIQVRVIAEDSKGNICDPVPSRTIYDDKEGPDFGGFSWTSGGSSVDYAKGGDPLNMSFTLNDTLSGVNHPTLTISGTDSNFTFNTALDGQDEGPYSLDFTLNSGTNVTDGKVRFTLTVEDNIGNSKNIDQGDDGVIYYYDEPTLAEAPIGFSNLDDIADTDYLRPGETLRISLPTDRDLNFGALDFSLDFDGAGTEILDLTDGDYIEDFTVTGTTAEGDIAYTWVYEDMAGNTTTFTDVNAGFMVDRSDPYLNTNTISAAGGDTTSSDEALKGSTVTAVAYCRDDYSGVALTPTIRFRFGSPGSYQYIGSGDAGFSSDFRESDGRLRGYLTANNSAYQGVMTAVVTLSDNAGNSLEIPFGDTVLLDSRDPVMTIDAVYGAGGTSDKTISGGETITVKFSTDEAVPVGTPPEIDFQIEGTYRDLTNASMVPDTDRKVWTATYNVPASGSWDDNEVLTRVKVEDSVGYSDTSTDSSLSLDNEFPTLSVDKFYAGTDGDTKAAAGQKITLEFTTNGTPTVKFFNDSNELTPITASGKSEYTVIEAGISAEPVRTGAVTATISVVDDHGNTSTGDASSFTLTMDNDPPVVGTPGSDTTVKDATATLSVTATDNIGVTSVTINSGSATEGTTTNVYERDSTVTLPGDPSTTYGISAVVTDEAGNSVTTPTNTITLTDS